MITESSGTTVRAHTIDLETLQLQSDTIRRTKLQCEVETCAAVGPTLLSVVKTRSLDSNLQWFGKKAGAALKRKTEKKSSYEKEKS
jgi:hypothetical protein